MVREALSLDGLRAMPADEAAAWLVMRRSEGLTEHEQGLLESWLATDAANPRALDGADRAWNWLDGDEDDEILAAMRGHARTAGPAARRATPDWMRLAAAAVLAVVVVGAATIFAPMLKPKATGPGPNALPAAVTYASAVGEVKTVALPDGSRMTLDADSTAVARIGKTSRSVALTRGRAFFAVVHDTARPFTVLAADRRLVDVGTKFDVNLGPDQLTVTLLEGRLAVGPVGQTALPVTLNPGQQLVHRQGLADQILNAGDAAQDAAAWRTGVIRFNDQSLAEAAAVMNRYSTDRIVIRSPSVAAIRVSGQFRAGQPAAFAETLTELYKLRSRRQGREIELLPAG